MTGKARRRVLLVAGLRETIGLGFKCRHQLPSTVRFADTGRDVVLTGARRERMGKGPREAAGEHALAGEIITLGKIVHGGLAEGEEGCGGPHRGLPAGRWLCTAGTGGTGGWTTRAGA